MDYINPVSIAQMYQTQKDTSLPGSGYGGVQGFLEGQAGATAQEFLRQSQAAAAQDFVKRQFDNQVAWEDRPFTLEKRGVELDNLRHTGRGQELTNEGLSLENDQKRLLPKQRALELLGSHYDTAATLQSPLERLQFADALAKKTQFGGYPVMDLNYDGSEESWQQYLEMLRTAKDSAMFTNQLAAQRGITGMKEAGDTQRNRETIAGADIRNIRDNATALTIANIRAAADRATQGGANAWNAFRNQLGRDWIAIDAKIKAGQQITPEEQATHYIAPQILAGGVTSTGIKTDPEITRENERAKTSGKIQGLKDALKERKGSVTTGVDGAESPGMDKPENYTPGKIYRGSTGTYRYNGGDIDNPGSWTRLDSE